MATAKSGKARDQRTQPSLGALQPDHNNPAIVENFSDQLTPEISRELANFVKIIGQIRSKPHQKTSEMLDNDSNKR